MFDFTDTVVDSISKSYQPTKLVTVQLASKDKENIKTGKEKDNDNHGVVTILVINHMVVGITKAT